MADVVRLFDEPVATPAGIEAQERLNAVFDECWRSWPRKDGKAIARQKFLAITRGGFQTRTLDKSSGEYIPMELSATPEQILAGVKAYRDSQIDRRTFKLKDDGKFVPWLSTWLGKAGWEDFT